MDLTTVLSLYQDTEIKLTSGDATRQAFLGGNTYIFINQSSK